EGMPLQGLNELGFKRTTAPGGSKRPIPGRATSPAGNLRKFRRTEPAKLIPVELAVRSERHMVDVEIESHPDSGGRDQIVDISRLIERDLGVACPRRKRAQHDGCASTLASNKLSDGVDLVGGERDDGGATRLARDLLLTGKHQLGQPWPAQHIGPG